jgi:hypothetical protein
VGKKYYFGKELEEEEEEVKYVDGLQKPNVCHKIYMPEFFL